MTKNGLVDLEKMPRDEREMLVSKYGPRAIQDDRPYNVPENGDDEEIHLDDRAIRLERDLANIHMGDPV